MRQSKIRLAWNKEVIVIMIVTLIMFLTCYFVFPKESKYDETEKKFIVKIIKIENKDSYLMLELEGKERLKATYYKEKKEISNLKVGDIVRVEGTLEKIKPNTFPNLYAWDKYYRSENCFYYLTVDTITKIRNGSFSIKDLLLKQISRSGKASSYLEVMLLGSTDNISDDVMESYRLNGVSHLFAVSGMHLSLLLSLFKKNSKSKWIVVIVSLLMLGGNVSYLRAVIYFVISELGKRRYLKIECIILTICSLLWLNPYYIDQVGFLFSVLISTGLLLQRKGYTKNKGRIRNLFLTSVTAFLIGLPLSLLFFYKVNLLTPFWNMIFVPFFTIVLIPMLLLTFFFPFFSLITNKIITIFEMLAIKCADIDNFIIIYGKPGVLELGMISIVLTFYFLYKKKYQKIIIISILILLLCFPVRYRSDEVILLDVGQGDATFLYSRGKNILIDTGAKRGADIVSFLESKGIKYLDFLFLSHGDNDHVGNALYLLDKIEVKRIIYNIGEINLKEEEILSVAKKKKIRYQQCVEGLTVDAGNFSFYSLTQIGIDENTNSCVFFVTNKYRNFLFTGDMTMKEEEKIMNKYQLPRIDYLKVAHHGSKTSTSSIWLNYLNPQTALISVGAKNRYNLPNSNTMKNIEEKQIPYYLTSTSGSIEIFIKKEDTINLYPPYNMLGR